VCNSIASFIEKHNQDERDLQGGIVASIPCSTDICNGTLRILLSVTPAPSVPTTFPFEGTGPRIDDFAITTKSNGSGELQPAFADLITGRGGTDLTISAGNFPPKDSNSFWQVDNINCTSLNGTTIIGTDVENGSGPTKGPLVVHAIGNGDTVSCLWHIHNEQIK
jgi:hypothetical protein